MFKKMFSPAAPKSTDTRRQPGEDESSRSTDDTHDTAFIPAAASATFPKEDIFAALQTFSSLALNYKTLKKDLDSHNKTYQSLAKACATNLASFENIAIDSRTNLDTKQTNKNLLLIASARKNLQNVFAEIEDDASSKTSPTKRLLLYLNVEIHRFPDVKKLYSVLETKCSDLAYYNKKFVTVSKEVDIAYINLKHEPTNDKLLSLSAKAKDRLQRNQEKLTVSIKAEKEAHANFISCCNGFEMKRRELLSKSVLGDFITKEHALVKRIFQVYTSPTIPKDSKVPAPDESLFRKIETKGMLSNTKAGLFDKLSHISKHKSTILKGKTSTSSAPEKESSNAIFVSYYTPTLFIENEYIERTGAFQTLNLDYGHLLKTSDVQINSLDLYSESFLDLSVTFVAIGATEALKTVTNSLLNSANQIKARIGTKGQGNCYAMTLENNLLESLRKEANEFKHVNDRIDKRVQVATDLVYYSSKIRALKTDEKLLEEKKGADKLLRNETKFKETRLTLETETEALIAIYDSFEERREALLMDGFALFSYDTGNLLEFSLQTLVTTLNVSLNPPEVANTSAKVNKPFVPMPSKVVRNSSSSSSSSTSTSASASASASAQPPPPPSVSNQARSAVTTKEDIDAAKENGFFEEPTRKSNLSVGSMSLEEEKE